MSGQRQAERIRQALEEGMVEEATQQREGAGDCEGAPYDAYTIKLVRKRELQQHLNQSALSANKQRYRYLAELRKHVFLPYLDYTAVAVFAYLLLRRRLGLLNVGGLALGASVANEFARVHHITKSYPDEAGEMLRLSRELHQIMRILQREYAHRYPLQRYIQFLQRKRSQTAAEAAVMAEVLHRRRSADLLQMTLHAYHSPMCL